MKKIILTIALILTAPLFAKSLDKRIANMFMLGFYGTSVDMSSKIIDDICRDGLGGVILFDKHPSKAGQPKNISSKQQLKKLNYQLSHACNHRPLIAVDQEGGKVQRLQRKYGFNGRFPKASAIAKNGEMDALVEYESMSAELSSVGINYNLAPVADMAVNRKNRVIYRLGRSYGADATTVSLYNKIFINAMHEHAILTSLKHFPGHGSSLGDTHKGFVDVTSTWSKRELVPFKRLIKAGSVDSIMVAHVFNKRIDPKYPASLSSRTVSGLLRANLGYKGVVITDDLQMRAISQHYTLRETLKLAINAGNDILLFGNQLDPKHIVTIEKLVSMVKALISNGEVNISRINRANRRISAMRNKINLGR